MNPLSDLTVIIVTYRTNYEILKNCISSIDKNVKIKIVENSLDFKDKNFFLNNYSNITIDCTGKNLGYSEGNNYGVNLINTDYALILSPDTICHRSFFEHIKFYLNRDLDFSVIGSSYMDDDPSNMSYGFFEENKNKIYNNFKGFYFENKFKSLKKVDWVTGCSMLINLSKFKDKKIFDENFFLYFEEFNLCKKVNMKGENVFSSKNLLIHHLGYKGSFAANPKLKLEAEKLREWHWMWSMFYFYKNNYGYLFALKKTFGKFFKSFIKMIYFSITFNKALKNKYKSKFFGLLNSMIGKKSWYRVDARFQ